MKVELGRGERAFWTVLFAAAAVHLLAYALLAYPAMPQTVPTHWGADGAVDGWGDKAGTLVMAAMPLVVALVMLAVPRLDPKGRNFERFRGVYLGMSAALTLFMVAVAWMTPLTAFGVVPEGGLARLDGDPPRARRPHGRARQLPAARQAQLHLRHPHALDARERGQLAPHAPLRRPRLRGRGRRRCSPPPCSRP